MSLHFLYISTFNCVLFVDDGGATSGDKIIVVVVFVMVVVVVFVVVVGYKLWCSGCGKACDCLFNGGSCTSCRSNLVVLVVVVVRVVVVFFVVVVVGYW